MTSQLSNAREMDFRPGNSMAVARFLIHEKKELLVLIVVCDAVNVVEKLQYGGATMCDVKTRKRTI